MAFERFYSRAPNMVTHLSESFRRVLLDKDPSVMGAALCLYHRMVLVRGARRARGNAARHARQRTAVDACAYAHAPWGTRDGARA